MFVLMKCIGFRESGGPISATDAEINVMIVSWLVKRIVEVEDAEATVGDGDYALLALVLTMKMVKKL